MPRKAIHIKAVCFHLEGTLVHIPGPEIMPAEPPSPAAGAEKILSYLAEKKLRRAIVSLSRGRSVRRMMDNFSAASLSDFNPVICAEDLPQRATATHAVQAVVDKLNLPADQVLFVTADPQFLQQAIKAATIPVFYGPSPSGPGSRSADPFHISKLEELKALVRLGIPLPPGKLPNDLLREFLNQFVFDDPSILVNPGVGEDTAAINVESEEVLVLKSDPITFATDSIGQYAVLINANDIATSGARPRWLLTTLLFPCGITPSGIQQIIDELKETCRRWDITLCGGHTEITDAVTRPVVTGMMAGTVAKSKLIDKSAMAPGDRVLITKGVAVEGTAIIAREFGKRLKGLGMSESEIDGSRRFLPHISVITEARIAAESGAASAMHDVTEGGLATALEELSIAGGHRLKIDMDAIPVFSETRKICRLLGIQPLGLIGSGSLLICCRETGCQSLMATIRQSGIDVSCIGEVLDDRGQGIYAVKKGRPTAWPQFEVDEITRLF